MQHIEDFEELLAIESGSQYLGNINIDGSINSESNFGSRDLGRDLSDLFKRTPKYAFFTADSDSYYYVNVNDNSKDGKRASKYYRNADDGVQDVLKMIRAQATFGNMATQTTELDETVRKGFDIAANFRNDEYSFRIDTYNLEKTMRRMFADAFGFSDVTIYCYKLNIYEECDFFKPHVDSPEKKLVGTIIVHVKGDYGCMYIDGEQWTKGKGNILMFLGDVVHEVKPCTSYRETLTYKVFSNCANHGIDVIDDKRIADFLKRVDIDDSNGILLNTCSTRENMEDDSIIDMLHGNDLEIFEIVRNLGLKYMFVPVIVKGRYDLNEYKTIDEEEYGGDRVYTFENTKAGVATYREENTWRGTTTHSALEMDFTSVRVYKPTEKILNSIYPDRDTSMIDNMRFCTLYYLGYGELLGKVDRFNMYIGNQCTGGVRENVYLNVMLFFEKNK